MSGKVLAEVDKWMERFDCIVIGPGLGRDPFLLVCSRVLVASFKYTLALISETKYTPEVSGTRMRDFTNS